MSVTRRRFLLTAAGGAAFLALPDGPATATPDGVAEAIRAVLGDAKPQKGRVKLDLPLLVDNGNTVAMTITVDGASEGPQRVESIHVFADGNPLPNVVNMQFGPRAAEPVVATRIRLATSQTVTAVAKLADGTCWSDSVELMVVLAACLDE